MKFAEVEKDEAPLNTDNIDILEQNINDFDPSLLKILLQDKTTKKYIRWNCDEYKKYGWDYRAEKEIFQN